MNPRKIRLALVAAMGLLATGPGVAASKVPVAADLTAVLALQGQPCGKVVRVEQQGDNDYIATCQDGNRYRVYITDEGRVVATKL